MRHTEKKPNIEVLDKIKPDPNKLPHMNNEFQNFVNMTITRTKKKEF